FIKGDFDILLSTTIIESGLDIPRANTIIINRADRFGLAELYQLRGRVGRSSHRAYAYLISPDTARLNSDARRRMEVIGELSELGSGFRVAAYDMEIRGAGELLGASQSGRIAEVGFDMYSELLAEAVKELKGEVVESEPSVEVNLKVSRFIPEGYVPDTRQRLGLYKRLATVEDKEELFSLMDELNDRYGELPEELMALFETARIKGELKAIYAVELTQRGEFLYITFSPTLGEERPKVADTLIELIKKGKGRFKFTKDRNFVYRMCPGEPLFDEVRYLLKEIAKGC
ncbi:MAG: transcription-repair coupling factor, partial [Deltaproteobacteria bacterium]|nr:transcription-repair coupling factor [Deltaproteobacteria bacterium]